jgi:hypothetical protein
VETFVWKTKSNEWLFRKKTFSYAILFTYTQYHDNRSWSYGLDAFTEVFRKNGSRLYAWWLTKTFRTQKSTKVWITNKIFRKHKSTKVWMTHKKIPQTRKKTKVYIQLHKTRQCCKQFSSVLEFSAEFCFDTKILRKVTINAEKNL